MSPPSSKLLIFFFISFILLASYPGWNGQFWFDDNSNILDNSTLPIQNFNVQSLWTASLSGPASTLGRPVSMLSFAINSYWHGFEPFYFKVTNTILHILNALLFFRLGYLLIQRSSISQKLQLNSSTTQWLAFVISLIWAITPINIASSLYIVQRMTELATFFTIFGCLLYIHVRTSQQCSVKRQILYFFSFFVLLLLALLSKENGVLLSPLVLLIELLLHSGNKHSSTFFKLNNSIFFYLILSVLFLIPLTAALLYLVTHPDWLINSYLRRDFTLSERVFSQFRILLYYLQQIILPDIYQISLLHDDYIKSGSLFKPLSTIFSLLFWLCLIVFSVITQKKTPWLIFGVLWFLIAHSLESTILPLELVFEHRNYTPSYGVIFTLVLSCFALIQYLKSALLQFILFGAYTLYLLLNSYIIASIWGNNIFMFQVFVENHSHSARSQLNWGIINQQLWQRYPSEKKYYQQAIDSYYLATQYSQDLVGGLTRIVLLKHSLNNDISNDLDMLFKRLKTLTPHPTLTLSSQKFLEKSRTIKPQLNKSIIKEYYVNLLSNPKLQGLYKAILLKDYADHIYLQEGMTPEVLDLLLAAINALPENIEIRIYFSQALINAGLYSIAKQIITDAYPLDKMQKHQITLNKLLQLINDRLALKKQNEDHPK